MIQLLHFSCWIQCPSRKNSTLSIKVAKRAPTLIKNYNPSTKIHIFDAINTAQLPIVQVTFNQSTPRPFALSNYLNHQKQPHVQIVRIQRTQSEDYRILFTFELLNNTQKLYNKYCHQKSDIQKHYLCQGIKDFIRSQKQFLVQFQRNEQIQQIRQLQLEEAKIQAILCEQIMSTKKYSISLNKVIFIIAIFIFVGFIIGKHDFNKSGNIFNSFFKNDSSKDQNDKQISRSKHQKNNKASNIKHKKNK